MALGKARPPKSAMGWRQAQDASRAQVVASGFDPESVMVPGDGPTPCKVMFIGMRPGKDEPWCRPEPRPFIGMAGQEFDRYLGYAGLRRDQVYVTNLVKNYRAGDKEPEEWEVVRDEDTLQSEISMVLPEILVPLGAFCTKRFLGDWSTMEVVSGIPHRTSHPFTVFPIYHPAAGLHNQDIMPHLVSGFRRLGQHLAGGLPIQEDEFPRPLYTEVEDAGQMWWHSQSPIAIDTEGWRHDPICLTYSRFPGEGRLIPQGSDLLREFSRRLAIRDGVGERAGLGDGGLLVLLHNSLHDLSVLDGLGVTIPEGRFIDTMVLAYLLCLEPQGLKSLAYRHAGMEMQSYEEVVGPASRRKALEYVQELDQYEWGNAEPYITMETVKGSPDRIAKTHRPHSLTRRISRILSDYSRNPEGTDIRERWSHMAADNPMLVQRAQDLCGDMPDATLRDVDPKVMLEYACRDADATLRVFPKLMDQVCEMNLLDVMRLDHDIIPMVDRMQRVGMPVVPEYFSDNLAPRMRQEMEEIQHDIQRQTGWWVNPDSGDQCAEFLFTHTGGMRLPWSKLTDSGRRPKCDDKVLEGLIASTKNPVVKLITDYRERSKIVSSFCGPIVRLSGQDGRIRCNLRITRVSSGRLAANTPNLLAIPVRTKLGLEVRRGFVAGPGRVIASNDLDQIEMREMAHQSQDPVMLDIFRKGNVDIHTQTASMMYGKQLEDVLTVERYSAKRIGFGIITGITEVGLKDQMDMAGAVGWTKDRCAEAIREYLRVYSRVGAFMEDCRAEARRYGFVRDRWGRIRYLPGVHSKIGRVRADAERQSHSFKISASAQGVMKRWMKLVWDEVWRPWHVSGAGAAYFEPLLQIHDDLLVECEEAAWHCIGEEMRRLLPMADPTFTVPLKSKSKSGRTWADLE